jgi:hypothetical protein
MHLIIDASVVTTNPCMHVQVPPRPLEACRWGAGRAPGGSSATLVDRRLLSGSSPSITLRAWLEPRSRACCTRCVDMHHY